VGSTITLGAAPTGYQSFLAAFGAGAAAFFMLGDGAGRTLGGVWTVNSTTPATATITEILFNLRSGGTAGETFSSTCMAWNTLPAGETLVPRLSPLSGFRNLLINANPVINQRSYVSGTATSVANQYTLDRWRVVTSGQSVTWTDSAGIRTVTAPAGGLEQVIEGASILGGTHVLSWTGSATAQINGSTVANGGTFTLPGNTNATLRFSGGTFSLPQIEPGAMVTPFERRPLGAELALCQRYYEIGDWLTSGQTYFNVMVFYKVPKRAVPTVLNSRSIATFTGTTGLTFFYQNAIDGSPQNATFSASAEL
jgi:hypothetical protein